MSVLNQVKPDSISQIHFSWRLQGTFLSSGEGSKKA